MRCGVIDSAAKTGESERGDRASRARARATTCVRVVAGVLASFVRCRVCFVVVARARATTRYSRGEEPRASDSQAYPPLRVPQLRCMRPVLPAGGAVVWHPPLSLPPRTRGFAR